MGVQAPDPGRGKLLGRYILLDKLGAGGMGTVHAAFDPELARKIAIKVLHPLSGGDAARERMLAEAQSVARLAHPNVVAVHDIGEADGHVFMAMELVEGVDLDRWIVSPRTWREVRDVFSQAGRGLAAAHAAGLVHRDVKPANILIGDDGRVRVSDFGLARLTPTGDPGGDGGPLDASTLAGTPAYMAPEQLRGLAADALSDQFSFCVSFYEALYRCRPFAAPATGDGTTALATTLTEALAVLDGPPRDPPPRSQVPAWLRTIVFRGLARDSAARFPSMHDLLVELDRDPDRARRRVLAGVGLGAVVLSSLAIAWPRGGGTAAVAPRCPAVPALVSSAWAPAELDGLRAGIAAAGTPWADGIAGRALSRIDAWTLAWAQTRHRACTATHERHEQSEALLDQRIYCLDRQLAGARAAVTQLGGDRSLAARALEILDGLEDATVCDDIPALTGAEPPPAEAVARRELLAIEGELGRADIRRVAGDPAGSLRLTGPLVERAERLGHAPTTARVRLMHGRVLQALGRADDAEVELRAAIAAAERGRADVIRANAWLALSKLVGSDRERVDVGLGDVAMAAAVVDRVGDDPDLASRLAQTRGLIEWTRGDHDRAIAELSRARAAAEEAHLEPVAIARIVADLGSCYQEAGRLDEGAALTEQALEVFERELGAQHPLVATQLVNLGAARYQQDRLDEALGYFQRALELKQGTLGADHPALAPALINIAAIEISRRDFAAAAPRYQRAIELVTAAYGPDHASLDRPLTGLGRCMIALGQPARAVAPLEHALSLRETRGDRAGLGYTRFYLAQALWPDPTQRARARALAVAARADFASQEQPDSVGEIDAWLRAPR